MILERLTLKNFGLFRGTQTIELRPRREKGKTKPIILIGGLNGGGKTTLLDAILLALYGKRARCSKKERLSYENFLRECIHDGTPSGEGACISLTFEYVAKGKAEIYEVRRAWAEKGAGVSEYLDILRNGVIDRYLSDRWNQLVEELVPSGLSQLFFFDGEKIRSLAEGEASLEALGVAVKSLLGLDLVERLITDSEIIGRRQARASLSEQERIRLDGLQGVLKEKQESVSGKRTKLAAERNTLLRAESALKACEENLQRQGGELYDQQNTLKIREAELLAQETLLLTNLHEMAAAKLPFLLLDDLLGVVRDDHQKRVEARDNQSVAQALKKRDGKLLRFLKEEGAKAELVTNLRRFLQEDIKKVSSQENSPGPVELSGQASGQLQMLLDGGMEELRKSAKKLLNDLDVVMAEREGLQRSLAVVPDEKQLSAPLKEFREASETFATSRERSQRLESEIEELKRKMEATNQQINRLLEKKMAVASQNEDGLRTVGLAEQTTEKMREFLSLATGRKIERLAGAITESFLFLLRKRTLVQRVEINPDTFAITLIGADGKPFPRQRLSEGEKQLFAVALLWGLAKSSSKPLPTIVDTPLGRLDSDHRIHLIERYFPNASHQVIVLSTDTEIDREYYSMLGDHISRAYRLDYNETERYTEIKEGYFWEEADVDSKHPAGAAG